jgi:hypothetical protein
VLLAINSSQIIHAGLWIGNNQCVALRFGKHMLGYAAQQQLFSNVGAMLARGSFAS